MTKYRSDVSEMQNDGAICHYAKWIGGPTLAKIENCRIDSLSGDWRVVAHITGEPDTWFSIPAKCSIRGKWIRGYVTNDDNGNAVFHHVYY